LIGIELPLASVVVPTCLVITLDEVTLSGIEKRKVVFSTLPIHTNPGRSVKMLGGFDVWPKSTSSILIVAVAAVFERGT